MRIKKVTKRDGSYEEFQIAKTRAVIDWACKGTNANTLELESHVDITFTDSIKTGDIQENLITKALSLVDIDNYDWLRVAANLRMMTKYKIYRDTNFADYVFDKINNNQYSNALSNYSINDLNFASTWIDCERDKIYDYAGANILNSKFLYEDEPLQYLYLASSLVIASLENNPTNKLLFAKDIYDAISLKKISLATPLLSGIRKNSASLASCFIGVMGDSIDEIFSTLHNIARISKNGGGIGIYIGDIRCNGSSVRGVKNASSGITGWIKLINDTVVSVNQLGRRVGACTVALPVWHYDIEEFLSLQTEHGDPRKKCFDIFPQLLLCDEFLHRVKNNDKWYCFDPYEVLTKLDINLSDNHIFEENYNACLSNIDKLKLVKEYDAKYIIKQIIKVIVETGLPYIGYIDTINRANPNSHSGNIPCVNLCVESFSVVKPDLWHTCSLSSLNLAYIDEDEIPYYTKLITRILDKVLDICEYPIIESKKHVDNFRTIGIGVLGLADYLAKNKMSYDSAFKNKKLNDIFETICYYSIDQSVDLAKEDLPYSEFKGSTWDTGEQIDKYRHNANCITESEWDILESKLQRYGIRNSQLMSPAPNTTSGLIQGATSGILPPYSLVHYDDSSNGTIIIMPPYLSANPLSYKAYKNYDMITFIDYIAEMQKWVDTGVSFEALFDLSKVDDNGRPIITAKYLYDFIIKCWESEIKANYYWRYITNNGLSEKEECVSCAG